MSRPPRLHVRSLAAVLLAATLLGAARPVPVAAEPTEGEEGFREPQLPPAAVSPVAPTLARRALEPTLSPTIHSQFPMFDFYDPVAHPPDPHGAAGPRGIISTQNRYLWYASKGGDTRWTDAGIDISTFFRTTDATGIQYDPRAIYDPDSGRFFIIEGEVTDTASYVLVAASKSSDPASSGTADWSFFRIPTTLLSGGMRYGTDFPGLAVDSRALYLTYNLFALPPFGTFKCAEILVIDKAALLAGTVSVRRMLTPDGFGAGFSLLPITPIEGAEPGNVAYFAEIPWYSTTTVRVWAMSDPLGTPVLSSTLVAIPDNGGQIEAAPQCAPGDITLETWSPRAQGNGFWDGTSLWFCHTAGGPVLGRAVVFYYRIATNGFPAGAPALLESGAIDGGPGLWTFMPAIGANARGDMVLVYTESGASMCPSIMVAGRKAGWPAFATPQVLKAGAYYAGSFSPGYGGARWGDYATVAADPVDGSLWVAHEYAPDSRPNNWGTWWGNIVFDSGVPGWVEGGVPLRVSTTWVGPPTGVSDGAGGAFIAWSDMRIPAVGIFVQRVTSDGATVAGWPTNGLRVSPANYVAQSAALADDGAGGVYVAWAVSNGALFVQRVTGTGGPAPGWPAAGVRIADVGDYPVVAPDGAGGIVVAWQQAGIRVLRLDPGGAPAAGWPAGGIALATTGTKPQVASDGAGGAIVCWSPGLRAQHVSASGVLLWAAGGLNFGTGASPRLVADGAGGALLVCQRPGAGAQADFWDLYALRVTGDGAVAPGWPAGGVPVCGADYDQLDPVLVPDGDGGAIVAWSDRRADPDDLVGDVYAQHVGADGAAVRGWPADGMAIAAGPGDQSAPAVMTDGAGGAVVAWQDARAASGCVPPGCGADIYVHHVTRLGVLDPSIATGGQVLCAAPGDQAAPCLVPGGTAVVLAAWADGRLFPGCDPVCGSGIYAQRATFDAQVAVPGTQGGRGVLELAAPWPNPAGESGTRIRFEVPAELSGAALDLSVFDLTGRRLATLASGPAKPGPHQATWERGTGPANRARPGIYFLRLRVGTMAISRRIVLI